MHLDKPLLYSNKIQRNYKGLKITECLLLGRKVMTNLDSIFKSRDITLPTKVRLVKAMVFLWSCMDARVGLWRKLSAKELMLLNCGVGEDSWESLGLQGDPTSQSILEEISPGISLEGMMLKLKLQFFGHLMQRVDSLEKTLMLGGIGGRRRRGRERMRWLDSLTDSMDVEFGWIPGVGDGQGGLASCNSWVRKELDPNEWLNWTELTEAYLYMEVGCWMDYMHSKKEFYRIFHVYNINIIQFLLEHIVCKQCTQIYMYTNINFAYIDIENNKFN